MHLGSRLELPIALLSQVRSIIHSLLLFAMSKVAGLFDISTALVSLGSFKLFLLAVLRLDLKNLFQGVLLT